MVGDEQWKRDGTITSLGCILRRDRWRQNYCLAKADVDVALLHKSYGLSIVADGEPALVKWEKSFVFSEPIRDGREREGDSWNRDGSVGRARHGRQ